MTSAWVGLYQAAILETDWSKIEERIDAADLAIKGGCTSSRKITAAPLKRIRQSGMH
jgi:hypothetical protein